MPGVLPLYSLPHVTRAGRQGAVVAAINGEVVGMLATSPCTPAQLGRWSAQFHLGKAMPLDAVEAIQQHALVDACLINPVFAAHAGCLLAGMRVGASVSYCNIFGQPSPGRKRVRRALVPHMQLAYSASVCTLDGFRWCLSSTVVLSAVYPLQLQVQYVISTSSTCTTCWRQTSLHLQTCWQPCCSRPAATAEATGRSRQQVMAARCSASARGWLLCPDMW